MLSDHSKYQDVNLSLGIDPGQHRDSQLPHLGNNFTKAIHSDTYQAITPGVASDLSGRSVVVTGAAQGIGSATAVSFAKAGAAILGIADRSDLSGTRKAVQAAIGENCRQVKIIELVFDVTDRAAVSSKATDFLEAAEGKLDILVDCAGHLTLYAPFLESDPDVFWKTWDVNLGATFNVTLAFLPLLLKAGERSGLNTIVNFVSIAAHILRPGASSYGTSKVAVLRWTEFLNAEFGERGLIAYAIHPGAIVTELGHGVSKELHSYLTDTPELPADTISFLKHERRSWLAGRYINCTWDRTELLSRDDEIVSSDKLKVRMIV